MGCCPDVCSRLFGFLAGTAVASASVYYYILGEYRVANQMLNEDIHVCLSWLSPITELRILPLSPRSCPSGSATSLYQNTRVRADRRNGLNTSFIFLRHFRAHLLYGSYWLSSLGSTSCYNKTANLRHGTGGKDRPVAKEEMKAICWIVFNLMGFFLLLSSIISCLGSLPAWVYHVLGVV